MSVQFARKSFLGALAAVSITLASFLSGVIVARILGVEGTGAVAYVVWLALMLAPVVDIGMSSAIMRYVPDLGARGEDERAQWLSGHLARVLAISTTIGILAVGVLGAVAGLWSGWEADRGSGTASDAARFVLPIFVAAQTLGAYTYAYLRGSQAFEKVARLAALSLFVQLACVAIGSLLLGVTGAVAGYAAGQVVPALLACGLMRLRGEPDRPLAGRVYRYSVFAWAANIANAFVWSRIEVFFLERSWGHEAVGQFTVALALTSLATQGPQLLTTGFLPLFSAKRGRQDTASMQAAYAAGTRLLAALAFPACFGMAAIMPVLLPMIYGEAFRPAIPAAVILVIGAAVGVTSVVATNLIHANERSDFVFFTASAGAVLAIMAGFLLVPRFGLLGAACGRATIQFIMVAAGSWFVVRRLASPLPFASLGLLALAALACGAAAALCVEAIKGPASLIAAVPAGAATYLLALRLLRPLPPSDLELLARIAETLPGPLAAMASAVVGFVAVPRSGAGPRLAGGRQL